MEHPVKDIRGVIRSLYQASSEQEQRDAVHRYFLPMASLTGPFCRVPSFAFAFDSKRGSRVSMRLPIVGEVQVPLLSSSFLDGKEVESRMLVAGVYKWTLCPNMEMYVESTVLDQRANLLYVTARQRFSPFRLVPLPLRHDSSVRVVIIFELVSETALSRSTQTSNEHEVNKHEPDGDSPSQGSTLEIDNHNNINNTPAGDDSRNPHIPLGTGSPGEPTFAAVASTEIDTSSAVDKITSKPIAATSSLSNSNNNPSSIASHPHRYRPSAATNTTANTTGTNNMDSRSSSSTAVSTSAEAQGQGRNQQQQQQQGQKKTTTTTRDTNTVPGPRRYRIKSQRDLYQASDLLRLFLPISPGMWVGWTYGVFQLVGASFCIFSVAVLGLLERVFGGCEGSGGGGGIRNMASSSSKVVGPGPSESGSSRFLFEPELESKRLEESSKNLAGAVSQLSIPASFSPVPMPVPSTLTQAELETAIRKGMDGTDVDMDMRIGG